MHHQDSRPWSRRQLVGAAAVAVAAAVLLLLPGEAWAFHGPSPARGGGGLFLPTPAATGVASSPSSQSLSSSIIRRSPSSSASWGARPGAPRGQQQQWGQQAGTGTGPLTRRSMLTVGHDAAVQTALPLLFGRWTLKENRVPNTLWGRSVQGAAPMDPVKLSFEVVLAPKGRLEQPLDSSLRGLGWKLSFKDIYATGRLEFKIVHPPPAQKLVANDQIPSIHYYSGTFCEGLDRVEGWVERYADIDDEKLGPIRKRVRIGRFVMKKNGGVSLVGAGAEDQQPQQQPQPQQA